METENIAKAEQKQEKPWDDNLKKLARGNPQAFVTLVLGNAEFIQEWPEQLKSLTREVDALFEVNKDGHRFLLHLEFQTYNDPSMPLWLLIYNILARYLYGLPVKSCVIYLLKDGIHPSSPTDFTLPDGELVVTFHHQSIELAEMAQEELLALGEPGVVPLLTLAKDGANRETAIWMLEYLQGMGRPDLITIGVNVASLIFGKVAKTGEEKADNQEWILRRLREMSDLLRDTPTYQFILREGLEKGRQEGRQEGFQEGLEKGRQETLRQAALIGLRQAVVDAVEEHFPKQARLAKKLISDIEDTAMLRHLLVKVSVAQTAEEIKQNLLALAASEAE